MIHTNELMTLHILYQYFVTLHLCANVVDRTVVVFSKIMQFYVAILLFVSVCVWRGGGGLL